MIRVNQFVRSILELPEGKGRVTVKDGKFVEMEPTLFNDDELKAFVNAATVSTSLFSRPTWWRVCAKLNLRRCLGTMSISALERSSSRPNWISLRRIGGRHNRDS